MVDRHAGDCWAERPGGPCRSNCTCPCHRAAPGQCTCLCGCENEADAEGTRLCSPCLTIVHARVLTGDPEFGAGLSDEWYRAQAIRFYGALDTVQEVRP